jgi:hypothetical protein
MSMILKRAVGGASTGSGETGNATEICISVSGQPAVVKFYSSNDPSLATRFDVATITTTSGEPALQAQFYLHAEDIMFEIISGNPAIYVSGA